MVVESFPKLLTLFETSSSARNYRNIIPDVGHGRALLERLPLLHHSHDSVFDNQMLAQSVYFGFRIGEVSRPTKYFPEVSSLNFKRSLV